MSLIKWRKREITTAVCSFILVIIDSFIFNLIWTNYYTPYYYNQFYSIGRYAAVAVCFGVYIFLGRLYGTFWLKISRISEIIYANVVTNLVTGGVMYGVAWIFIRHLPAALPMLLIICLWTVVACLWVKPAIMMMNHYCAVERMVIIYDNNSNHHNGKAILSRVAWRFNVVGEICAEHFEEQDISFIMEQLRIYRAEVVLLCDISPMAKSEILKYCILENIAVYVQPGVRDYLVNSGKSVQIANMPFLFCQRAYDSSMYVFIKRFFDIVLSLAGLIICGPVMLVTALLVKRYDHGPVFTKEQRISINKKRFTVYKFRTVKLDAREKEDAGGFFHEDRRLTPVGKALQRFKIDELPQLLNVFKGELAVVGPKAEEPEEATRLEKEMPEYALKFQVKAGLTGYVQIFGRYSTNPKDRLQMDLMYIGQQNLAWDLKMILATIKVIFLPEGMDLILDGRVFTEEKRRNCGQTET